MLAGSASSSCQDMRSSARGQSVDGKTVLTEVMQIWGQIICLPDKQFFYMKSIVKVRIWMGRVKKRAGKRKSVVLSVVAYPVDLTYFQSRYE